jgi:hypothetical protein
MLEDVKNLPVNGLVTPQNITGCSHLKTLDFGFRWKFFRRTPNLKTGAERRRVQRKKKKQGSIGAASLLLRTMMSVKLQVHAFPQLFLCSDNPPKRKCKHVPTPPVSQYKDEIRRAALYTEEKNLCLALLTSTAKVCPVTFFPCVPRPSMTNS